MNNLRILVVDDNPSIADTTAQILALRKHDVRVVYSASEAIPLLEEFGPDAVISDVVMPGMSGIDLALHVAKNRPACRVLLLSGYDDPLEKVQAVAGQAISVLQKPVHPQAILGFAEKCLQEQVSAVQG